MNDAFDIGSLLIDFQVQQRFTRTFLTSRGLITLHVDRGDIVRLEEALRMHGRRAQHFVLANSNGNVSVIGGSKPFIVQATSDLADVLL